MKRGLQIKRIYEPVADDDGERVLVDRLWPRGVSKHAAALSLWLKEVAPSPALRKWWDHDPQRWIEFQRRYRAELKANAAPVQQLRSLARQRRVTLLYGAHDPKLNHALVLASYLKRPAAGPTKR